MGKVSRFNLFSFETLNVAKGFVQILKLLPTIKSMNFEPRTKYINLYSKFCQYLVHIFVIIIKYNLYFHDIDRSNDSGTGVSISD